MITNYANTRTNESVLVSVTSDLAVAGATVFYYWFLDGVFRHVSTTPEYRAIVQPGERVSITCYDTLDGSFDPATLNLPASRRTIWWTRSTSADVAQYRVEQQRESDAWETIATVDANAIDWTYEVLTPRLDDLTWYQWRVVAIDEAYNESTALEIDEEYIVRPPDAPDFELAYNGDTDVITATSS